MEGVFGRFAQPSPKIHWDPDDPSLGSCQAGYGHVFKRKVCVSLGRSSEMRDFDRTLEWDPQWDHDPDWAFCAIVASFLV